MEIDFTIITVNLLVGIIYFWIYFRFNDFLQMADKSVNLAGHMSRAFGFIAVYFAFIVPSTFLFLSYPIVISFIHWISDFFVYLGISQIAISILILLSPSIFFRWRKIVYIFVFAAVIIHFYYYFLPSTKHVIVDNWSIISAENVPVFINYAPFLFWMFGFLTCAFIFFILAFRFSQGYAKKRSVLIGVSMLIFSLSYPLSQVLFYFDAPFLPPIFSFLAGVVGLYILTSTSCIIGVYSLFYKRST